MEYLEIESSFQKLIKKIGTINGLYISIASYYDSDHPMYDYFKDTAIDKKEEDLSKIREIIGNDGFWNSFNKDLYDIVKNDMTGIVDKHLIKLLMEIERCLYFEHKYFDLFDAIQEAGNEELKKRYERLSLFFKAVEGFYHRLEQIRDDIFSYLDSFKFDRATLFDDKFVFSDKFIELKKEFKDAPVVMDPYPGSGVPVKALITYVLVNTGKIKDFPSSGKNRKGAIMEYGNKNFGCSGANFVNCFYKVQNGTYPTEDHLEEAERFLASDKSAFDYLQTLRPDKRFGR